MKKSIIVTLAAATLVLTGCATGSTQSDEQAVQQNGGINQDKTIEKSCVKPTTKQYSNAGDKYFYYPAGQRTWNFTGGKGSDSKPIATGTEDRQQVITSGQVTFSLTSDCKALREFHQKIGSRLRAYSEKSGEESAGWGVFLRTYLGTPLRDTISSVTLANGWQTLAFDPAKQAEIEKEIKGNLEDQINQALGGDYIKVSQVTLQPIDLPAKLRDALETQQEQSVTNATQKSKYAVLADCQAQGKLTGDQCVLLQAIQDGKIKVIPVPSGGSLNITP